MSGNMTTTSFKISTLSATATDEEVTHVLELSRRVFGYDPQNESRPHSSLDAWRSRLADPKSRIVYAYRSSPEGKEDVLGFFFSFAKVQEPELDFEALHIWLAGVTPAARGLGIFPKLLEETKRQARLHGYSHVTVCTIPSRFEKMYRILQANGWELVGWRKESNGADKVLMKLKL